MVSGAHLETAIVRPHIRAIFRLGPRPIALGSLNGGSRRFLRDDYPRTPPGPEGSNGSGHVGRRRGAGVGRLHYERADSGSRMADGKSAWRALIHVLVPSDVL
jgi:hypothetical protein